MSRWKIVVGMIVVFLLGLLVGIYGARVYALHKVSLVLQGDRPALTRFTLAKLSRELSLNSQERERIAPLVDQAVEELLQLRLKARPRVDEILDRTVARMKDNLRPEQQRKLEDLLGKFRAKRRPPGVRELMK